MFSEKQLLQRKYMYMCGQLEEREISASSMWTDPVLNTEPDQYKSHLLLNFNIWGL